MTDEKLKELIKFRNILETELFTQRGLAEYLKSDDIVCDDSCNNVVLSSRAIAEAFNSLAKQLGVPVVEVPEELECDDECDDY